jgi:ubiquinone biosynthesis protein
MISIRKIGITGRTYRHAKRHKEILSVLIKYGFGDLVDVLKLKQYIEIGIEKISEKQPERIEKLSRPARVRMALEELGPTFVKLGQILSTRPDLIPLEYVQELSKLHDDVPSFPYEDIKETIKSETGRFPEEIFRSFDQTPIAAASLGQVHKAILKDSEEVVAVKVQRPNIQQTIEVDLEIMLLLASLMERHVVEMELLHPTNAVNEFARSIEKELDYTVEASHIERFARQFLDDDTVYVPKVYRDLSTQRILVMEFVDGIKASDFDHLEQGGYDLKQVASRGAGTILKQICVYGFYHADPHPGNIFILPNNVICFIDFGMMGRISQQEREDFTDFVELLINRDEDKVVDALLKLTHYTEAPNRSELRRSLAEFIDQYAYLPLEKVEISKMLRSILEILNKQGMSLEPHLYLMIKALSTAEGLGRFLDPEFEIGKHAEPFFRKVKASRYTAKRIAGDLGAISGELREVLKNVRDGKLRIEIAYHELDRTLFRFDLISDRIASAIVLAALIVGSSIIILSRTPPRWHDMPIIGLLGFLIAAVMGFWLLTSILRRGRGMKKH